MLWSAQYVGLLTVRMPTYSNDLQAHGFSVLDSKMAQSSRRTDNHHPLPWPGLRHLEALVSSNSCTSHGGHNIRCQMVWNSTLNKYMQSTLACH